MPQPAVFLDRDDTLIEDPGYISRADQVKLKPGAVDAVRMLRSRGYRVVVATNQSGVARGLVDETTLNEIHDHMRELFAAEDAPIDAVYYCPYLDGDEATVEEYRQVSDLRKPRPGMLLKAARELGLDLTQSWAIGDAVRDVQAGRAAGCRTVLISQNGEAADAADESDFIVPDVMEAARVVVANTAGGAAAEPTDGDSTALLREILHAIRSQKRRDSAREFSLGWLTFVIIQVLAMGAGFWAMYLLAGRHLDHSVVWFAFAVFLQIWALTIATLTNRSDR